MAYCNLKKVRRTLYSGSDDCASLLRKINNNSFIEFLDGVREGAGSLVRDRGFSKIARLETLKGIIFQESSDKTGVKNEDILKKIIIAQKLVADIKSINRDLGLIVREIEKGRGSV